MKISSSEFFILSIFKNININVRAVYSTIQDFIILKIVSKLEIAI